MHYFLVNGMLITISVKDQWALLPIGWFPEEISVKTELLISASIVYTQTQIEDDLSKTIDYQCVSNNWELPNYTQALKNSWINLIAGGQQHHSELVSLELSVQLAG